MEQFLQNTLQNSQDAFQKWRKIPFEERQKHFTQLSEILNDRKQEFATIITQEMNKPISQSVSEIEKCAALCDYYAAAENILKTEQVETEFQISEIHHEPLGVILGVMPWNFPFWQAIRFAVPTILAGNVIVLKHASICEKSGETMQEIFEKAGFPKGIFTFLKVSHTEVEEMIAHPIIRGVSLTGSEAAGRKIAETAGKNLKKCVLELGGSDAFIVCEDADVSKAAKDGAQARLQNNGQTCVAGKRFIIHEKVYQDFVEKFTEEYQKYQPENPMNEETKLGLMAREDLASDLEKQYQKALNNGAKAIVALESVGSMAFKPGILEMNPENPIAQEELFGPLAMVFKVKNDEEALQIANNTMFGLGNAVFTSNKERALFFAENLESGSVAINQIFRSDVRLPFGGRKNSGYGVELSLYALKEFTAPKTIIGKF